MAQPFCAVSMADVADFTAAPWPVKKIGYYLDTSGYVGNLTVTAIRDIMAKAWASWAEVIDIQPFKASNASAAQVVMRFGAIDGPSNVLAWSHLSDGTMSQKQQLYDAGESWETQISMLAVASHELGHVLGLEHQNKNVKALMRPIYDPNIRAPQSDDVERMIKLGYQPAPIIPPTPAPSPAPTGKPFVFTGWTGTDQVVAFSLKGLTKVTIDPGDLPKTSALADGVESAIQFGE